MLLHFYKMTGAGNDFVMVDNRDLSLSSVQYTGSDIRTGGLYAGQRNHRSPV